MQYLYLYLLTVPIFFAIDMTWIGLIANGIYTKYIGEFITKTPNWPAAVSFYLLYIIGILYFVVVPAHDKGSVTQAAMNGALFGLFAYATYDLTNLATIKGWPLQIVFIDMAWGMVLTASVGVISFYIAGLVLS